VERAAAAVGLAERAPARALGGRVSGPVCAVGSGVALVASFAPYSLSTLSLVALAPLFAAAAQSGWRGRIWLGWLCGVVAYGAGCSWAGVTIGRLQDTTPGIALALTALFAAWHALQFAVTAAIAGWLLSPEDAARDASPRPLGATVLAACGCAGAWVSVEWAFPRVLPWSLGDLAAGIAPLRGAAALGGVWGLAFAAAAVNALIAGGWVARRGDAAVRQWGAPLLVAATALLASASVGRLTALRGPHDIGVARVALVQGALPAGRDDLEGAIFRAWSTYAALTEAIGARVDLVVWPEESLPVYLRDNPEFQQRLAGLAQRVGAPLLLGALDRADDGSELNAAYVVPLHGAADAGAAYHKSRLLAFGEYVPGAHWLPAASEWRTTGTFSPGAFRSVVTVPTSGDRDGTALLLAAALCVEGLQPGWFNRGVHDGAGALVALADESWFGAGSAAEQHLAVLRLRAVETGRWLVRASNSGRSAFIDPSGVVVAELPDGVPGVLIQTIGLRAGTTPYVVGGDWVVGTSAMMVVWAGWWRWRQGAALSRRSRATA